MMRTPSLALASLVLCAAPVAAQSGLSLVAGLTSATLTYEFDDGTETTDFSSRLGFAIGLGMEHAAGSSLTFAPELLFALKGTNTEDDDYFKFSYVETPLLFRYYFGSGGSATPFITAGPTIAYLAACAVGNDTDSEDCDDTIKTLDYGVMFGAGVKFDRFGISARYELGLANIAEAECCTGKNKSLFVLGSYAF